jgi:hypothetical protein
MVALPGSPHAAKPDSAHQEGQGVARLSSIAIPPTAQSLLPRMVTTMAKESVRERATQDLQAVLGASKIPSAAESYASPDDYVFTAEVGLSDVGRLAMSWLKDVHLHGFDALAKRVKKLQATNSPTPAASVVDWGAVDVKDASLLAAWEEASQSTDPLRVAGEFLSKKDDSVRQAAKRYVEYVAGQGATRAQLELGIWETLAEFLVNVRPTPRTSSVLRNKESYLSPDTLWKGESWKTPTAEQYQAMMTAARQGTEGLTAYIKAQLPQEPQYMQLVEAAKAYETMCAGEAWPQVIVRKKPKSWRWRRADNMKALQTRLRLEGFYEGDQTGLFDAATKAALKSYQKLRHLKANGYYTAKTARNLNVSCERRQRTLVLNAQRWRHTARTIEDFYIFVNLPAFEAKYVIDNKVHTERRVVVGAGHSFWSAGEKRRIYKNRTPILSDSMSSVIVNPTWTVPQRIILNELQPKIDKDPEYLEKNGYITKGTATGRQMVVQLPGENNALGVVKFYFPNAESIYMHDTPKKGVFNVPHRDYSHGCVRVHEALDFATTLLREDYRFRDVHFPGGLKGIVKRGKTATMKLYRPVPVFLEYYTASVNTKGQLMFHPDIYDYDHVALVAPLGRRRPARF